MLSPTNFYIQTVTSGDVVLQAQVRSALKEKRTGIMKS